MAEKFSDERVGNGEEDSLPVSGRLVGLIDRAEQLGEGNLKKQGVTVIAGKNQASMGPELAYVDRRGKFMYYAQLIDASTSDTDESEPAVYMSVHQKTGGDYQVVKEVRIGASGEGVGSDEANQVLDFFEIAVRKAEQGGGRLANSPFARWFRGVADGLKFFENNDMQQDARWYNDNPGNQ